MKNILVTGGFGFLGGHLVELLVANPNNHVHVVDNLSSNPVPYKVFLDELSYPQNLTYAIEDVEETCTRWNGEPFDHIYHLASLVGPAGVLPHAGYIAEAMVRDAVMIAELTQKCGARLLFVSSSEVYGGGQEGLCCESMPMIISTNASPRLEYAAGKLSAEILLLNMCRAKDLDIRIVRPFNISGPRQSGRGGFVLPRFIGQALAQKDITVFGDGSQIRAFTHVRDMVEGLVQCMETGPKGELYNMGNQKNRCSILDLAREVKYVTQSKSRLVFVDPKTLYGPLYEDANDKFPDAEKSYAQLGWRPRFGRMDTVVDTLKYMTGLPPDLFSDLSGFPNRRKMTRPVASTNDNQTPHAAHAMR